MPQLSGVYAALLTPRMIDGDVDLASFEGQLHAPAASGLRGYAINGATGEFTFVLEDELRSILSMTREAVPGCEILCGIGAADVRRAVRRAAIAADEGADALLLPMPSFFPYRQDDLVAFSMAVADAVTLPVLLYNLPQFTSGLHPETVLQLLEHENIVGIKDSSGSLEITRAMTRAGITTGRIIGNDGALGDALQEACCDGVVSGVACALPELMTSLFAQPDATKRAMLEEFIAQLDVLPTPWGLKVTSAVRGFTHESYPFPLSGQRHAETEELRAWFKDWLPKVIPVEGSAA